MKEKETVKAFIKGGSLTVGTGWLWHDAGIIRPVAGIRYKTGFLV